MAIACARCGAEAEKQFGFTQEPVCLKCFSAAGVCSSCGKNFGSDAALKKIGAGKNCPACDARLNKQVDGLFGGGVTRLR